MSGPAGEKDFVVRRPDPIRIAARFGQYLWGLGLGSFEFVTHDDSLKIAVYMTKRPELDADPPSTDADRAERRAAKGHDDAATQLFTKDNRPLPWGAHDGDRPGGRPFVRLVDANGLLIAEVFGNDGGRMEAEAICARFSLAHGTMEVNRALASEIDEVLKILEEDANGVGFRYKNVGNRVKSLLHQFGVRMEEP